MDMAALMISARTAQRDNQSALPHAAVQPHRRRPGKVWSAVRRVRRLWRR